MPRPAARRLRSPDPPVPRRIQRRAAAGRRAARRRRRHAQQRQPRAGPGLRRRLPRRPRDHRHGVSPPRPPPPPRPAHPPSQPDNSPIMKREASAGYGAKVVICPSTVVRGAALRARVASRQHAPRSPPASTPSAKCPTAPAPCTCRRPTTPTSSPARAPSRSRRRSRWRPWRTPPRRRCPSMGRPKPRPLTSSSCPLAAAASRPGPR